MGLSNVPLPLHPNLRGTLASVIETVKRSILPPALYSDAPGNDPLEPDGNLLADLRALGFSDVETLLQTLNSGVNGVIDDNDLLQEHLIQLLSRLPSDSKAGKKIADSFINQLWNGLDHPPVATLGEGYKYRSADGSGNSLYNEKLGAANTPYSRTVRPEVYQVPVGNLPEPELIFDLLMARGKASGNNGDHPNGISSMLFYLATIIIHDIFQTDNNSKGYTVNTTSSYVDLAPLYGRNLAEQKAMRTFKDGLLKSDCFSSTRIHGQPSGVGVFLIMFNRFHNYVVTQLALINDGNRFPKPVSDNDPAYAQFDEDLFQTGRLVTTGLYGNIILHDYVRTILNLNRTNSTWALDPRTKEGKNLFSKPAPQGIGNQVSAEFNLIYRWHSAISTRDEKWAIEQFQRLLPGRDPTTANWHDVVKALGVWQAGFEEQAPEERTFAGLQRQDDGSYNDDELVKILQESIDDVAGAFGANRVPDVMRSIEVLGIIQARSWNLCTLNEFRAFVGLTKHKTFEDINPDPVVAKKLRQLYDAPDSVELYPGLVVEKPKPPMVPGSGLCVNFTTSWAILADAVALVRGDRFLTTDYTPDKLTNWGHHEVSYDTSVNQGHVMYKLIFRAFPKHFSPNSIYAHFPFVTPPVNKDILSELQREDQYSWDAPSRTPDMVVIRSNNAVRAVLDNQRDFKVAWGTAMSFLTARTPSCESRSAFCLSGDGSRNAANRRQITTALYPDSWTQDVRQFYTATVRDLIAQYNAAIAPGMREVDVIRDVIHLANTRFMCAMFSLPLKTDMTPHGIFTEQEMVDALGVMFRAVFLDTDVAQSFALRNTAREAARKLGELILRRAEATATTSLIRGLAGDIAKLWWGEGEEPKLAKYGHHMIARMSERGKSVTETVWGSILPFAAASSMFQTQMLAHCLEFYLGQGMGHLEEIQRLARLDTPGADQLLMKYVLEGCRISSSLTVYRMVDSWQVIDDDYSAYPQKLHLPPSTIVMVNLNTASHDAGAFKDPNSVRLDRPLDAYVHYGRGAHQCVGSDASRVALTTAFKELMRLKGLRRAPGERGNLKSMPAHVWGGQVGREETSQYDRLRVYLSSDQSSFLPVPSTMRIRWEE